MKPISYAPIRSRRAFSLVEVMISVALSMVVLMLAFYAFRVATQSMGVLNRLATENDLLRTGITQVIDDADFWNSEANPEFPYGRAYAGFQNVNALGTRLPDSLAAPFNHGNNKRPFRPVQFAIGSARDANWILPHDARGWYRNMIYSNPRPHHFDYRKAEQSKETGHPQTNWSVHVAQDQPIPVPLSWTPRHIWGDYAEIASVVPDLALPSDEQSYRSARAILMEGLFRELGVPGVTSYLPQGTMTMYLRPSTNLYDGTAFNDTSRHYDKGEIPWQLDRPKILNQDNNSTSKNMINEALAGKWDSTVEVPIETQVAGHNRVNYVEALQFWHGLTARDWAAANRMRGIMYGMRVSEGPWPWANVNTLARQGWGQDFIRDVGYYGTTTLISWVAGTEAEANRNDTYLVPAALTGDRNPMSGDRVPTLPLLRVSNFRYRYYSGDICNLAVRVEQPSSGRVMDLGFSVLGTTFRGARQHWALRTWGMRLGTTSNALETSSQDTPAMGDYYK